MTRRDGVQNRRLVVKLYKDFGDRTGRKVLEFLFVLQFLYTVTLYSNAKNQIWTDEGAPA